MTKLLKSDFKRVLKDKLFLVMCILAVVFALITPLLYKFLLSAANTDMTELLGDFASAKSIFFASFAAGDNLGLIVPVLISIVLCKDFSFGTVRNKIISGKSRISIFMSMFTVCAVFLCVIMLLHALLSLAVSLMFFDYQAAPFESSDLIYLLVSVAFELLIYVFVAALVCWLCVTMKNVGLVIVLYVAINLVLTMIAAILQVSIEVLQMGEANSSTIEVLEFFQRINLFNSSMTIGTSTEYATKDVLYIVLPALAGILGLLGLGALKFKKKDLK